MTAPSNRHGRPKVGVGVIVTNQSYPGCILLGKRKGKIPGSGQFALPGGHLEFGESWEACGARETLEETGLKLTGVHYCAVVNAVEVENDYHYITLFVRGEIDKTFKEEPENLEPDKCEGWFWCPWTKFPPQEQLFCALRVLREEEYNPFEDKVTENKRQDTHLRGFISERSQN